MTRQNSNDDSTGWKLTRTPRARPRAAKQVVLGKSARSAALCALFALAGSMLVAPTQASATPFGFRPFAPGSVAQGGTLSGYGRAKACGVQLRALPPPQP
jgi:hypothetical protein